MIAVIDLDYGNLAALVLVWFALALGWIQWRSGIFAAPNCRHCFGPVERNEHGDWICSSPECFNYRS